ncbi:endonuclease/exonuclease/phosphatase family protein [Streptomyces erythrochromogenes]|uniref:endonuclease/exonuclease/phosphatase family protein n=1 Tax=Streptomyces erythrochromogenes TaxID=285574 RepID=UPI00386CB838|nr:endonuclease/exonuclease/phosphatase family protein [Streptomyces erythrochromogenes]
MALVLAARGRRGLLIAVGAVCAALTMALHPWIPNGAVNLGSLFQTFLPWAGLSIPVLLVAAAVRRSRLAAVAVLAPMAVWGCLFGGTLADKRSERPGGGNFTVVSHNVDEENPDPARTARALAASGADVLALEEMSPKATPVYERELATGYPYRSDTLGVRLWSKHPLNDVEAVPIMPWTRAVRATVETPGGPVAVYAAHLASVRVTPDAGFTTARRNDAARKLAAAVRAEPLDRVVVMGDLNGTADDSALRPLTSRLTSAQREAGAGFGFTWPAALPVVRIDQILVKGMSATSSWTLPATGSDHLPVAASLRL